MGEVYAEPTFRRAVVYDGAMSTPLKGLVIGRSTGRCAVTDRVLEPGTSCFAALARPKRAEDATDKPMIERLDFDASIWEDARRDRDLAGRLLCWWRTEIPEPGGRRNLFVDDGTLVDLFERMEDEEDEHRLAFRFVLGLILLRRRRLRVVDRLREDGREIWHFRRVGGGDDAPIWKVADPQLSEEDADAIAEQLSTILSDEG